MIHAAHSFRSVIGVVLLSSLALSACAPTLDRWGGAPSLNSGSSQFTRWLVIKCTYSDDRTARTLPTDLHPSLNTLDEYIDMFLTIKGAGTGNLVDYVHDVTYGKLSFQARVMGWYDAPFSSTSGRGVSRTDRVQQCANAMSDADAALIDFADYRGIIAVTNEPQDGGACYEGLGSLSIKGSTYRLACLTFDSDAMYTAFAAHEVGHGLGLPHSADQSLVAYTDEFDLMSAFNAVRFTWPNYPGEGPLAGQPGAGPGLSVPNLLVLEAIPAGRIATWNVAGGSQQRFTLTALSRPASPHLLAVKIIGPSSEIFTVEYRQGDGWDRAMPQSLVVIHRFMPGGDPLSVLQQGPTRRGWAAGQLWANWTLGFSVFVESIDTATGTAVVWVNTV